MLQKTLLTIGSFSLIIWGIAHLIPTKSVVKDFGDISLDNRRIIQMEWINEGFTLIFLGGLVFVTLIFGGEMSLMHKLVYISPAFLFFAMAILSLFTGAKINFLPFKLCPVIFSFSAVLILLGTFL